MPRARIQLLWTRTASRSLHLYWRPFFSAHVHVNHALAWIIDAKGRTRWSYRPERNARSEIGVYRLPGEPSLFDYETPRTYVRLRCVRSARAVNRNVKPINFWGLREHRERLIPTVDQNNIVQLYFSHACKGKVPMLGHVPNPAHSYRFVLKYEFWNIQHRIYKVSHFKQTNLWPV